MSKTIQYREGDWFAIPLDETHFSVGLIARRRQAGCWFYGYFFKIKYSGVPSRKDIYDLSFHDVFIYFRCYDLGIELGEWQIIASTRDWNRKSWPILPFSRSNESKGWLIFYSDALEEQVEIFECSRERALRYSPDVTSGHISTQMKLARALASTDITVPIVSQPESIDSSLIPPITDTEVIGLIDCTNDVQSVELDVIYLEDCALFYEFEDEAIVFLTGSEAGYVDGIERGRGTYTFFFYGPDADTLYEVLQPMLAKYSFPKGSSVTISYGKSDRQPRTISLPGKSKKFVKKHPRV